MKQDSRYGTIGLKPPSRYGRIGLDPTAGETARAVVGGIVGGATETAGMAMEGVGLAADKLEELLPESWRREGSPFRTGGQAMQVAGRGVFEAERAKVKRAGGATGFLAGDVPEAVGSSLGLGAGALLTGGVGGVAAGVAMTGTAAGMAHGWNEAKAKGATDEDAWTSALLNGGVGATEAVPLAKIFGRALKGAKRPLQKLVQDALFEAGEEAAQETFQTIAGNAIAGELYDEERQIIDGVLRSGSTGAVTGFLLSALGGAGFIRRTEPGAPEAGADPVSQDAAGAVASAAVAPSGGVGPDTPLLPPQGAEMDAAAGVGSTVPAKPQEQVSEVTRFDGSQIVAEPTQTTTPVVESQTAPDVAQAVEPAAEAEQAAVTAQSAPVESAPKHSKAPPSEPKAQSTDAAPGPLAGIKNAEIEAEFAAMGVDPPTHGESMEWKATIEAAHEQSKADPTAGKRLIDELDADPREITAEETALSIVEANRLKIERDAAREALDRAVASGEGVEAAQKRVEAARADYIKLGNVLTLKGTGTAQALAIRRLMVKRDYSLAEMERVIQDAGGGEPLSKAEVAQIQELHDQIAKLTTEHEKVLVRNRELEAKQAATALLPAIKARARRARAERPRGAIREKIRKDADESREFFRQFAKRAHTGLPVDAIPHLVRIGADVLASGATEFSVWSKAIIAEVGERAKPHLEAAYKDAKKALAEFKLSAATERIRERMTEGKDFGAYVSKIAEHFVGEGITELDPLLDAVHAELKKVDPQITRERTRDAMSGYGRFRPLTADEIKRQLADLKGQAQKVAQIEALEKKLAPLKTGFERVEPSDKQRKLQKRVNQLKKQLGIKVEDPTRALKSALQSKETALRNRIDDLRQEIETGQRIVADERPSPTSEVTDALEKELDALRSEHEAIFGKPGASDEAKAQAAVRAAERALAENERRLKEHDLGPPPRMQGPGTEEVEALRAKRRAIAARSEAIRAELDLLRAVSEAEDAGPSAEEKRLQKQIDEFGKSKPTGARQTVDTEAVAKLRAQLHALRDAREAARKAARKTPEQIALAAKKARDKRTIADLEDRIARGDFSKKSKPPPVELDPEAIELKAGAERAKAKFARLRAQKEYENRTSKQKAVDSAKEVFGLTRALKTALDVSAVLRQGGILSLGTNPATTARQIREMFKAMNSVEYAEKIDAELRARPGYEFGRASKLELTNLHGGIGPQEEAIRSRLSDKIPGIPASNRAFITFLNMQRAEAFDAMVRALPHTPTIEDGRALAHAVNVMTGRGHMRSLASAMGHASNILWSPRLLLSRIQFLVGEPLWRATPATRRIIAKQYAKSFAGVASILSLAALSGLDVGDDPRSSDFGKIIIGDTRIDLLAGLGQVTTLISRLATGETKTIKGKVKSIRGDVDYGRDTSSDVIFRFIRTKLTPLAGSALNVLDGKNVVGEKTSLLKEVATAPLPLSPLDVFKAMKHEGVPTGAALGILTMFGASIQTIDPKKK